MRTMFCEKVHVASTELKTGSCMLRLLRFSEPDEDRAGKPNGKLKYKNSNQLINFI